MVARTLTQLSRYTALKETQRTAVNSPKPLPSRQAPLPYDSSQQQNDRIGSFAPLHTSNLTANVNTQNSLKDHQLPLASPRTAPPHADSRNFDSVPNYTYRNPYGVDPSGQGFQPTTYTPAEDMSATMEGHSAYAQSFQQPSAISDSYPPHGTYASPSEYGRPRDQSSWAQYTSNMNPDIDPHPEYISSASALVQLGRSEHPRTQQDLHMAMGMLAEPDRHQSGAQSVTPQNWPYLLYDEAPPEG